MARSLMPNNPKRRRSKLKPKQTKRGPRRSAAPGLPYQLRIHNRTLIFVPEVTVTQTVFPMTATAIPLSLQGMTQASQAWLASQMDLYDKFRFVDVRLEFVPVLSVHSTGAMAVYYDPDTKPSLPKQFVDISGNYGVSSTQVYKARTVRIAPRRLRRLPWYQTHQQDATGIQGNLVFANTSGAIPEANGVTTLGMWWMEYTLELQSPSRPSLPTALQLQAPDLDERPPNQPLLELEAQTRSLANLENQVRSNLDVPVSTLRSQGSGVATDVGEIAEAMASLQTNVRTVTQLLNKMSTDLAATSQSLSQMGPAAINTLATRMTTSSGVIRRVNNRWNIGTAYSTEGYALLHDGDSDLVRELSPLLEEEDGDE